MAMKSIFSLITFLILCSFDKVSTKAVYTTYNADSTPDTYPIKIFLPFLNLSSIDEPSERDKLMAYVIEELELLTEKFDENSPLILHYGLNYIDEDYYEEEEEEEDEEEDLNEPVNTTEAEAETQTDVETKTQNEDETETQTEDETKIETETTKPLEPEFQAAIEEFMNKVLKASEKYWKSLSAADKTKYEDFSEWLEEFKNTKDVVDRMDLINVFFQITEHQTAYK